MLAYALKYPPNVYACGQLTLTKGYRECKIVVKDNHSKESLKNFKGEVHDAKICT